MVQSSYTLRPCKVCEIIFLAKGRNSYCSTKCRKENKRLYDKNRYPSIAKETVKRACLWQEQNRDRKQEYDRKYRERMGETRLAAKRLYSKEHPRPAIMSVNAAHKRRARKLENGCFLVLEKDYARLLSHYRGACAYCQTPFDKDVKCHWDHVIPLARGGRHSIGNLLPACASCNYTKNARLIMEWRMGKVRSRSRVC